MENIRKSFQDKKVLHGINCDVKETEIFGLLGPSGAGKTTIINILTGQLRYDSGRAALFGVSCSKLSDDIHEKIGMVLDDAGLYSRLSCYDNLVVFADIFRIPKKKISEALENVKLSDAAKKPVSKLSKGMAQRLVLARALLHEPKLLFLDEPTSGLDPSTAQEIHKLILERRKSGTTVFLTTHNMEEATKLCDNVALLNEGVIVEYGAPETLCRKHNTSKQVKILLKSGQETELPCDSSSAKTIADYFANDQVESIRSSEPNLETVFIKLTGRELK
jgi:ABC-2 type transport system ATP-binding protein